MDTQHDTEYLHNLEQELQKRNVTGVYRWLLEYAAASGLWWNTLWWEWCDLNGKDIIIGWVQNAVLFGLIAFKAAFVLGIYAGIGTFFSLHLLTTCLGLQLRAGTQHKLPAEPD